MSNTYSPGAALYSAVPTQFHAWVRGRELTVLALDGLDTGSWAARAALALDGDALGADFVISEPASRGQLQAAASRARFALLAVFDAVPELELPRALFSLHLGWSRSYLAADGSEKTAALWFAPGLRPLDEAARALELELRQEMQRAERAERVRAELVQQVDGLTTRLQSLTNHRDWLEGTRSWKITEPLRTATRLGRLLKSSASVVRDVSSGLLSRVPRDGVGATLRWAQERAALGTHEPTHVKALELILERFGDRPIIVSYPLVDWNIPLFQRPQHLALNLARAGYLYFFVTGNARYDAVHGFQEVEPGCFVTDQMSLLLKLRRKRVIHVCSTAVMAGPEVVTSARARGDHLLYEYIDELHEDISGAIPESAWARHRMLTSDPEVVCVASADRLLAEVVERRQRNVALVTNGVEYEHFAGLGRELPAPGAVASVVARGRPILGYYGALAKWFDFDLVRHLARARRDLEIVLVGPDYDGSAALSRLDEEPNVTMTGSIHYGVLPQVARFFDVSLIPFKLNDITASTSPIKLFEYMALGRPIVTTDLIECRKYASVMIGRDPHEFTARVGQAFERRGDAAYLELLRTEALQNTWAAKAKDIDLALDRAFNTRS